MGQNINVLKCTVLYSVRILETLNMFHFQLYKFGFNRKNLTFRLSFTLPAAGLSEEFFLEMFLL